MCDKNFDNISAYIDDMLYDAEIVELEQHLENCANCNQVYKNLLTVKSMLLDMDDIDIPDNLHSSIMDKVSEAKKEDNKIIEVDFKKKSKRFYYAASIIVALIAVTPFLNPSFMQPKTTVMADDLNLNDRFTFFKQNDDTLYNVSVLVDTDDINGTRNDLTKESTLYGDTIVSGDTDEVSTMSIVMDKEDAPEFVSYIVDNYENTQYTSNQQTVAEATSEIETKIASTEQKIKPQLAKINPDDTRLEDELTKLSSEKQNISNRAGKVTVNVTIK